MMSMVLVKVAGIRNRLLQQQQGMPVREAGADRPADASDFAWRLQEQERQSAEEALYRISGLGWSVR